MAAHTHPQKCPGATLTHSEFVFSGEETWTHHRLEDLLLWSWIVALKGLLVLWEALGYHSDSLVEEN